MSSTRETLETALRDELVDRRHKPVRISLQPGLSQTEIDEISRALPVPPPDDVVDLWSFCSGIAGLPEEVDFTGRGLRDGFGLDFVVPQGFPIAHDGCGNYWVVDLQPEAGAWGPIYYCCHDAPVILVQAASINQFASELLKRYRPPHRSLIDDVHEDRLFDVWQKNPGVVAHAAALASPDPDLMAFAATLDSQFEVIDLRHAPVGMGFAWGRYGPKTEVRRFGEQPIFAYRKPEKTGLLSRLLGR